MLILRKQAGQSCLALLQLASQVISNLLHIKLLLIFVPVSFNLYYNNVVGLVL